VLPILRLVVWAVIAVALCVIAFRETAPAFEETDDGVVAPGADFTDPVVEVTTQTVTNAVDLTGTIVPVAATEVTAPGAGTAVYFAMPSGRAVADDEPLMTLRSTEPREPRVDTDDEGNVTEIPQADRVINTTVYASADGEITFEVELNEEVAQGDVVARIDPHENYIAATVPAESLYRLLSLPPTATVTIANGPEPFECTGLTLESATIDGTSSTELRCEVPDGVTVFPGLAVEIAVVTDTVTDAVVVPLTAVRGTFESGSVWVVGDDGVPVETPVALGITDGKVVEVTEGASPGDTILQFVPGSPAEYPDGQDGMIDGDDGGGESSSEEVDDGSGEVVDDGSEG
jgi:multidrug efflux pump subunit AcrA (membrane-fusion protein)